MFCIEAQFVKNISYQAEIACYAILSIRLSTDECKRLSEIYPPNVSATQSHFNL